MWAQNGQNSEIINILHENTSLSSINDNALLLLKLKTNHAFEASVAEIIKKS